MYISACLRRCLLTIAAVVVFTSAVLAAESSPTTFSPVLRFSYTQRMRIETYDNTTWLAADSLAGSSYYRQRVSLMAQYRPSAKIELALKLTEEMRYYFVPEKRRTDFDQLFVDQLYARLDSVGRKPVNVILGRQNVEFGEGFLVMDGGPLDGSRSAYFNAARADWTVKSGQTLTLVVAYQPRWDGLLPVIHQHNRYKLLTEQNELGFMLHYNRPTAKGVLQAYLLRKQATAYQKYPRIDLNCLGARAKMPVVTRLTATSEAAIQFGRRGGQDQFSFGGYLYVDWATGWPELCPRTVTLGGLFLSGDRYTTSRYEGWDPFWGRWPKWSESYAYALAKERAIAYWTNMASLFARTTVTLTPVLDLNFEFHHLTAPRYTDPTAAFPGGNGRTRGNLTIIKLTYKADKNLTGHVLYESFRPGDFYKPTASAYGWMRMEVMLKF
ncbi:hypothetical protein C3F09_07050 [candidate division GN15 bacterium]|uniref:Alginate export domain-containing protein n=1 Tax=candidate division GN15 bacterium TaxID=2072418 RepID=A0A855X2F9_9BACT|nr:MAG: hypothetical protein C3F09_07050 [candidate division GN15 bacterium]